LHLYTVAVLQVSNPNRCTRPHFEWANALLVVAVEQLLGCGCDLAKEAGKCRAAAKAARPAVA
jgi:hypothetical protein